MDTAFARPPALLILPALLGAVIALLATSLYGAGIDGDSVYYCNAGENLLATGRLVNTFAAGPPQTLTHFPPLYPTVLAPLHLFEAGIEHSAAYLNALLFVLYIAGIQLLTLRATDASRTAALLAGLFAALSTAALSIYVRVWSETVFLVLFLYGMLMLSRYHTRPKQATGMPSLLAAAGLFALAWLARYVGVTLVVSGVLAILLWSRAPVRRQLRDAVLFGLVATVPMGLFLLRNYRTTENVTDRMMAYHPVSLAWWGEGMDTLSAWLIPIAAPVWMKAVAACAVMAIATVGVYFIVQDSQRTCTTGKQTARTWTTPAVLLLFCAVYLAFFYVVVTFADSGHLSGRTLSPVFSSMIVVAAYVAHEIVRRYGKSRPAVTTGAILLLCGALLTVQLLRSATCANQGRVEGFDFSARAWQSAPAVDILNELPPQTPLHSNWPPIVYFLTGRPAHPLAFAHCYTDCTALDSELLVVSEHAVIVWTDYLVGAECYDCLLSAAPETGFVSTHEDDHFHLFARTPH